MVFEVKSPILGFENIEQMKLEKIDDIFMKLMNVKDNIPTFTLVNPTVLREYIFDIPTAIAILLNTNESNRDKILVANIMVISKHIQDSTINFLAPLVFNFENQTMAQVVLDITKYPHYGVAEPISSFLQDN